MTTCPHSDRCVCIGACKHGFAGNGASEFSPASTRRATAVGKHARGVLSGLQRGPDTATERHWQARVDALDAAIAALQAALSAEPVAHRTWTPTGPWQWMSGPPSLGALDNIKVHPHWRIEYAYSSPVAGGAVAGLVAKWRQSAADYRRDAESRYEDDDARAWLLDLAIADEKRADELERALAVTAPDSTQPLLSAQGAGVSNAADSTGRRETCQSCGGDDVGGHDEMCALGRNNFANNLTP